LYLPIVTLIVYSFNGSGVGGFPPRDFTLDWYRELFTDDAIWNSVLNSLFVAFAAVAIALALGIPAALALDRANFPGKALFRRLVLLPLILPGIITGLSLLMLFREGGMKLSLVTIILGHGTALISVATTEVFAGLQKLDRAQEEASLDLGANYWQTFWRVTLPNLRLSIIGAALLIFRCWRRQRIPKLRPSRAKTTTSAIKSATAKSSLARQPRRAMTWSLWAEALVALPLLICFSNVISCCLRRSRIGAATLT